MAIVQHAARVAATLAAILRTRLKLAAVEMEEESLRYLTYLGLAMLALLLLFVGLVLLVFLVIVMFWDTHRIAAIATLVGVRASFRNKPKLLSFTMDELSKDLDALQHLAQRGSEQP